MSTDTLQYADNLKKTFHIVQALPREHQNNNFSSAHLLKTLPHKEVSLLPYLKAAGRANAIRIKRDKDKMVRIRNP